MHVSSTSDVPSTAVEENVAELVVAHDELDVAGLQRTKALSHIHLARPSERVSSAGITRERSWSNAVSESAHRRNDELRKLSAPAGLSEVYTRAVRIIFAHDLHCAGSAAE